MDTVFEERQRFRQKWVYVLLAVMLLPPLAVMLFAPGAPIAGMGIIVAVLLGTLAMVWFARLSVTVTERGIVARFAPFHVSARHIAFGDIAEAHARRYDALREYGGWGLKLGFRGGWAWTVSGDEGVQLVLKDGRSILIGSQRSAELARAIQAGIHSAA